MNGKVRRVQNVSVREKARFITQRMVVQTEESQAEYGEMQSKYVCTIPNAQRVYMGESEETALGGGRVVISVTVPYNLTGKLPQLLLWGGFGTVGTTSTIKKLMHLSVTL